MNTKLPLTIKDTQTGLIENKFTVVDLVDSYLENIEKKNKKLNIFLTVTKEEALKKAKNVDKKIKEYAGNEKKLLQDFPLFGVVVAHKDIFVTKGVRTTSGAKVLENYVPQYSASVVKKLDKAGAVIIGKVNMDAWAHGSSGENSDFGETLNPWNENYTPGGSSSGSGATLPANMSLVSTGTDTCGSVRVPANFCGVYGLKPTYGAVSRYGAIAMASSLDSVGHMGRSVDDIRRILDVTIGEDGKDSTVKKTKMSDTGEIKKIGIPKEFFGEGLEENVKKNIDKAIKVLKSMGIEFVEISLPHTKYGISVYYIIQPAEVSSNLSRFDGIRYGLDRNNFGDEAIRRIMLGTFVLSSGYYDAYYLKAMKVRTIIKSEVDSAFEKVDAIIAPVTPSSAFKLGEKIDDPLKMYLTDIYAATANLSGIPALSIPFGKTKNNLPLGFQLMGPRFSEHSIFDLVEKFEKETKYLPVVAKK